MVFSLFSVNNFRIGGAPPFRSIKYLPNGEKSDILFFTNLSRRLKENPAHAHRFRTYPLPHAHCLPVRRSSPLCSAGPGRLPSCHHRSGAAAPHPPDDFSWTCDGELVCVHDWNAFYGRILDTDSPTLAQFEAVRDSTYGFTSLTLDHLIAWLREHPGVSIVTDIKEDCAAGAALIAQRCPDLRSRFIIQIYHPEEYDQVADLGFEHIILTVYQMSWSEKQDTAALVRFAAEHPLEGITFPAELADTPGYVEALLEAQVPLFVHTVNDPADQAALVRQGISGIYTDLGAPAPQE